MWKIVAPILFLFTVFAAVSDNPEYIKQCKRSDPQLIDCLKGALHHLRPWLATGIQEIEMPSVEPFVMDTLSLQLTGGQNGYRINLKNLEVLGASNFTVKSIKMSDGSKPFEAKVFIPKLVIQAKYTSSGVLIIIPASGGGEFHAVFEIVNADLKGVISTEERPEGTFMHVDKLSLLLDVKKPRMSVAKIFNNNRILNEATNLFLKENGHEILKAMQPQLQKKLASEFAGIGNALLKHVPVQKFLTD